MSEDQASATVKPSQSKLPTSLRHLFDKDVTSAPDPFRIPGFSSASKDAVSGFPGSPVPPSSPATSLPVARDRAARRALRIESSSEDALNLSTTTFAFPPRTISNATKAKAGSSLSPPDDQLNSASPYPGHVDKPFFVPGSSLSETSLIGSNTPAPAPVPSRLLGRRDLRLDPGDPELEIPSQGSDHEANFLTTANDDGASVDARLLPALSRRSPSSRNRSQSTPQGPLSTSSLEQDPPLPSDFHFPPYSSSSSDPNQLVSFGPEVRHRARISPTRASAQISLHNPAQSLDARISPDSSRRPSPPSLAPPALARSRSATPADDTAHDIQAGPFPSGVKSQRRPSIHRLASLTVVEMPPTASPTRPWSKFGRGRSGNSAGGVGDLSGIPDLKDVLKVNLLHLLLITLTQIVLSLQNSLQNTNLGCPIYYLPLRQPCIQISNLSRLLQVT